METEIIICDRCGETCEPDQVVEFGTLDRTPIGHPIDTSQFIHLCEQYCYPEFSQFFEGDVL